jgi:hypothetical protein
MMMMMIHGFPFTRLRNMQCAVPWGETLHELTELKGRRIPVEMIAIHVSFSPLRMFHW